MAGYTERKRLLLFGLPWTFTKYEITEDLITINKGLFNTVEDDCYMYKIQDVQLKVSLWEKIFSLGTVVCYTGDTTNPTLLIEHIRNSREIKKFILEYSEEARLKRRVLTTMDVSGDGDRHYDFEQESFL